MNARAFIWASLAGCLFSLCEALCSSISWTSSHPSSLVKHGQQVPNVLEKWRGQVGRGYTVKVPQFFFLHQFLGTNVKDTGFRKSCILSYHESFTHSWVKWDKYDALCNAHETVLNFKLAPDNYVNIWTTFKLTRWIQSALCKYRIHNLLVYPKETEALNSSRMKSSVIKKETDKAILKKTQHNIPRFAEKIIHWL